MDVNEGIQLDGRRWLGCAAWLCWTWIKRGCSGGEGRAESEVVAIVEGGSEMFDIATTVPIDCRTSPLTCHSIEVKDISLTDYINVNHAVYVPHTAGRYAKKQFAKGRMPIVERLVNA